MQNHIPNGWQELKLGEVVDVFDKQRVPISTMERVKIKGNYPYYGASGIVDHINKYIFDGDYVLVSEDGENLKTRNTPIAFLVSGKFWVNNHAHIIRAKKEFLNKYLIAYFSKLSLNPFITGSAQPKLTQDNLLEVPILLPNAENEQKRLVTFISSIDDKIAVNNKIVEKLEDMAQTNFKEWFENFHFPGYEKVKFVDSELGRIPYEWQVKQIRDVVKINKGLSYSSDEIREGNDGLPLINLGNFQRGGGFKTDGIKFYTGKYNKSHVVTPGDLVIAVTDLTSNREVIGHPARVPDAGWNKILISLDVCAIEADQLLKEFLYYLMLRRDFTYLMASSASGTNVSHLSKSIIEDYMFTLPTDEVIRKFKELVNPLFIHSNRLVMENEKLTTLRDLLLPKLMRGVIRV